MKKTVMSLERKRSLTGYLYLIPWLLGILLFFLYPLFITIYYSFSNINMSTLKITYIGIKNFKDAFYTDAKFPVMLTTAIGSCAANVPLILIFSFMVALLLRKKFKGNFIVKAIFFLTVILASDVFLMMRSQTSNITDAPMQSVMTESSDIFTKMESFSISKYLIGLGINSAWVDYIDNAIQNISTITIRSGIQIFIFLAGLNAIPDSMYEASHIEGATAWENIWKITLPLMTPMILVNLIYTIVDSFETLTNPLLNYISNMAFSSFNFGYSAALSIIYFGIILSILGIVVLLIRKRIYYQG